MCRESLQLLLSYLLVVAMQVGYWGFHPLMTLVGLAGVVVYYVNIFWINLLLGVLAARFRDIEQAIIVIMRVMFFVTPIIWTYDPNGEGYRNKIALFNPFTHYLEIVRKPLMGEMPPTLSVIVVATFTCVGAILGFLTFAYLRRRIPFWI